MKLKLIQLLLLLTVIANNSYSQNVECSKFLYGSFKIVDDELGTTFIRRYEDMQFEIMEGAVDTSVFMINWISECSYTLIPTEETLKLYPSLPLNPVLTVEIIETKPQSYIQVSTSNFSDMKYTREVVIAGGITK